MTTKIQILDKGYIELLETFGDELTIVNAARVSFGDSKTELDIRDKRLLKYLYTHKHMSPFRHLMFRFRIKAPEFVMRQAYKHCYDSQTEVLTDYGWKKWYYVGKKDKLAAVNTENNTYNFETPSDLICHDFTGELCYFSSNSIDLLVTDKHRMTVQKRDNVKNCYTKTLFCEADQCMKGEYRIPKIPTFNFKNKGNKTDFYMGALYGFFLGAGNVVELKNTFVFRFNNERKHNYIQNILDYLNVEYKYTRCVYYCIYRIVNFNDTLFCGTENTKKIDFENMEENLSFYEGVYDGLINSDDCIQVSTSQFITTSIQLAKTFCSLCLYLGKETRLYENKYSPTEIIINIPKSRAKNLLYCKREMREYSGKVYCATVSTGCLLIRRNDKIVQCGNCVGIEATSNDSTKDHAWNEVSGRYKPVKEYYIPDNWREQSTDSKQASSGSCSEDTQQYATELFTLALTHAENTYQNLLKMGVAKEQARIILPLNQYTEVIWTCSAQAILNFVELRDEPFSQWEIREYAIAFKSLLEKTTPFLSKIWFKDNKKEE